MFDPEVQCASVDGSVTLVSDVVWNMCGRMVLAQAKRQRLGHLLEIFSVVIVSIDSFWIQQAFSFSAFVSHYLKVLVS